MVPVRDEAALRWAVRPTTPESLYLFAVRGEGDVMARMFDLSSQRAAGMPGSVTIAQGELAGRPSFLFVEVAPDGDGWTMEVEGGVRRVGEGAFEV